MVSNECLLALIGNHGSNLSIVLHMKLEKKCGSMVPNQFPLVTDWEVWIQKKKSRACVYSVYPKIMNHGSMGPHFPISTEKTVHKIQKIDVNFGFGIDRREKTALVNK